MVADPPGFLERLPPETARFPRQHRRKACRRDGPLPGGAGARKCVSEERKGSESVKETRGRWRQGAGGLAGTTAGGRQRRGTRRRDGAGPAPRGAQRPDPGPAAAPTPWPGPCGGTDVQPWAAIHPGPGGRLDRHHPGRVARRALGAHGRHPRSRHLGADGGRRRSGATGSARRQGRWPQGLGRRRSLGRWRMPYDSSLGVCPASAARAGSGARDVPSSGRRGRRWLRRPPPRQKCPSTVNNQR